MISIKYQLFLFDTKAERKDQLSVVEPAFQSPSAIDALLKAVKFENKRPLIAIGTEAQLEKLSAEAERLDLTEWLSLSQEQHYAALQSLCEKNGVSCKESLGDREQHLVAKGEITAASRDYPYPSDLPNMNQEIWDAIKSQPDFVTATAEFKAAKAKLDKIQKMAVYRNFYEKYCQKMQIVPWANLTVLDVKTSMRKLMGALNQGRQDSLKILQKIEDHLLHAGKIKKTKAEKFKEVSRHPLHNQYTFIFEIPWVLDPVTHNWKDLTNFFITELSKTRAYQKFPHKLVTKATQYAELEFVHESDASVLVHIKIYLTVPEAITVTQEQDEARIHKKLTELAKRWARNKNKEFPEIAVF